MEECQIATNKEDINDSNNIIYRTISRDEIEKFEEIDRSELIEYDYHYKDGNLELVKVHFDVKGFSPEHLKKLKKSLYDLDDENGTIYGAFDGSKLVGLSALENKFRGEEGDMLNFALLHVSNPYRNKGIGRKLSGLVINKVKELGAKRLYVSASPTKNTVDFYMGLGFKLAVKVDEELFALEPKDIHLIMDLDQDITK